MTDLLKKTALNEAHRALGAKMVDFAGWDMPVQYAGLIPEHLAVRTAAGLFDVSHMGEIEVRGRDALRLLQLVTCNDVAKLTDGQVQYTGLMTEAGTFVDDILIYRFAPDSYFCCINASNIEKAFAWMTRHATGMDVEVRDVSADYVQIALQGPKAAAILQPLVTVDPAGIGYYRFVRDVGVFGAPVLLSRTGYTGEDGFELYFSPDHAVTVWNGLLEAGKSHGLAPAGLGARNTLRLEAKMALYGHDIDETTTVLEADLGWMCKLGKGDFLGRDVLVRQKEAGLTRKLIGFEVDDRAPVRDGYPIVRDGVEIAVVSSGSPAPFLKKNIGMAYLPIDMTAVGTPFDVLVRGRAVPAHVVETPFYKRSR